LVSPCIVKTPSSPRRLGSLTWTKNGPEVGDANE
jgi:hypothetical protein